MGRQQVFILLGSIHMNNHNPQTQIKTVYANRPLPRRRQRTDALLAKVRREDQLTFALSGARPQHRSKSPAGLEKTAVACATHIITIH
jgi:hypothetical protein